MIGTRVQFRDDAKIGAKEATPEFGQQFFAASVALVLGVTAEIAANPIRMRRPVATLMTERGHVRGRVPAAFERRHRDVVGRRGMIGLRSTVPDHRGGVADEVVGMSEPFHWIEARRRIR